MGENIRIEIHCINTELNITLAVGVIGLSIWLACLMTYFSVGSLIMFIVVLAAFIALAIASEKLPTVVIADEKQLRYKHLFGWRAIELSKISGVYIKVIAEYTDDDGILHPVGEEMFITGDDQMIYYPAAEDRTHN